MDPNFSHPVVPVPLPVVVHGPDVMERFPDHIQQSGSACLPSPRSHCGQHGEQPEREGHERRGEPHTRRYKPVSWVRVRVTERFLGQEIICSFSSVLSTLVKNKTLVSPVPPVAQSEARSLPSSSGETLAARGAPSQPSEERAVSQMFQPNEL